MSSPCLYCSAHRSGTAESLDEIAVRCNVCGAQGPRVLVKKFETIKDARKEAWRLWDDQPDLRADPTVVRVPVLDPLNLPKGFGEA